MLKKAFYFIFSICVCISFYGCSSGEILTFTAAVETAPSNFDPQIAQNSSDLMVITNIFDGLFENRNGEIVNNVADSYTVSPDGKTYTITLKNDCVFHCKGKKSDDYDGKAVTAHDFVFALQRVVDPSTHSPYSNNFLNIKNATAIQNGADKSILGVKAKNDYTLVIELESPDFNFTEKLAMTAAFPCNQSFFEKCGGAYGLSIDNILSNGSFRLNYLDTDSGDATILRVVDGAKNNITRIRIVTIDSDMQKDSYVNGNISGFFSYSSQDEKFDNSACIEFDSANICLLFNPNNNTLSNANVRKALGWYAFGFTNSGANLQAVNATYSIFPDIITLGGKSISEQLSNTIPEYMNENPKELITAGLNELGITKADALTILMPSDSIYTIIYENINQLWQRDLNQFFTIEYLTTTEIQKRVENGNFDIAFLPLTSQNNTPYGILDKFSSYDSQLLSAINTAKSAGSNTAALSAINTAQNIIISNAFAVPMGSNKTTFYYQKNFDNIYIELFDSIINLKHAVSY